MAVSPAVLCLAFCVCYVMNKNGTWGRSVEILLYHWSTLFQLFIDREQTKMADSGGAEIWSKKFTNAAYMFMVEYCI